MNKFGRKINAIRKKMMDLLMNYAWPGNIRELQNIIERAVVLSAGPVLTVDPAFLPITPAPSGLSRTVPAAPPRTDPRVTENRERSTAASFPVWSKWNAITYSLLSIDLLE